MKPTTIAPLAAVAYFVASTAGGLVGLAITGSYVPWACWGAGLLVGYGAGLWAVSVMIDSITNGGGQ